MVAWNWPPGCFPASGRGELHLRRFFRVGSLGCVVTGGAEVDYGLILISIYMYNYIPITLMVANSLANSYHESQDSAKDYNRFRFTWMEYPRAPHATHVAKVLPLECM